MDPCISCVAVQILQRLRIVLLCVAGNCTYKVHGAMDAAVSDITSNLLLHGFLTSKEEQLISINQKMKNIDEK